MKRNILLTTCLLMTSIKAVRLNKKKFNLSQQIQNMPSHLHPSNGLVAKLSKKPLLEYFWIDWRTSLIKRTLKEIIDLHIIWELAEAIKNKDVIEGEYFYNRVSYELYLNKILPLEKQQPLSELIQKLREKAQSCRTSDEDIKKIYRQAILKVCTLLLKLKK